MGRYCLNSLKIREILPASSNFSKKDQNKLETGELSKRTRCKVVSAVTLVRVCSSRDATLFPTGTRSGFAALESPE